MKKFNCPSCGAEVVFRSNVSVYAVCSYCMSTIVRHDVDVQLIGTMAALPDDMSPLQVGTVGTYRGQNFSIVGRMKIGWADGTWNEWFIVSDDGHKGWLAEAQGSYAISFEFSRTLHPNTQAALNRQIDAHEEGNNTRPKLGSYLTFNNQKFKVTDIKQATCLGSEGELPFIAPKGRKSVCIDLMGEDGAFASIEIEDDKQRIYLGHYVEWDDMRCKNLRPLEGW